MRNIEFMYQLHGKSFGLKCADCCNFVRMEFDHVVLLRCEAYGITESSDTDWKMRYVACGLFDIPFDEKTMKRGMDIQGASNRPERLEPLDGQIKWDV